MIGWTLDQFWRSTPAELYFSVRGWQRAQGIDPDERARTPEEAEKISERVDDALERRLARGARKG